MKAQAIVIGIILLVYTFLLCLFGAFGSFVHDICIGFIKNVLPIILIIFGYFLAIFLPIRINQAIKMNKERQEEFIKDQKLKEMQKKAKARNARIANEYYKTEDEI